MRRCKLTLTYEGETTIGYGDDIKMRASEKLAALHALYQLDAKGTVRVLVNYVRHIGLTI